MTPATCLGTLIAGTFAATQASAFAVTAADMGFLFAFGALNLGLGLAFFATGARLIPAAFAALLGTFETLLGPVWVWLVHAEVPSAPHPDRRRGRLRRAPGPHRAGVPPPVAARQTRVTGVQQPN